ncbi:MAG: hypothetical protein DRQ51_02690 [Gammaproteobacteria bacterium]|nr:MAG: hypothetical protein DRQ51_02690 [Gammaproteobacteria bacterium]
MVFSFGIYILPFKLKLKLLFDWVGDNIYTSAKKSVIIQQQKKECKLFYFMVSISVNKLQ